MNKEFNYGTGHLSIGVCLDIAAGHTKGIVAGEASMKVHASWQEVKNIVKAQIPVYGINTGFGPLCDTRIDEQDTGILQANLLKSHSVGIGNPVPPEIAKLMMICKVHALAQGYSGINPVTLERIIWHIDHDIIPLVPEKGSVGASGDLAPLSHLFLPLIGLGDVFVSGKKFPAQKILKEHGLEPLVLGTKRRFSIDQWHPIYFSLCN